MRKGIIAAVLLATSAVSVSANNPASATKFLKDYVAALEATRAGDVLRATDCAGANAQYSTARNLITSYTVRDPKRQLEMEEAAALFARALDARSACSAAIGAVDAAGLLTASSIKAAWAVYNPVSVEGLWVSSTERRRALHELQHAFGPVSSGPRVGQTDLETAASAIAVVLADPAHKVFAAAPRISGNVSH